MHMFQILEERIGGCIRDE